MEYMFEICFKWIYKRTELGYAWQKCCKLKITEAGWCDKRTHCILYLYIFLKFEISWPAYENVSFFMWLKKLTTEEDAILINTYMNTQYNYNIVTYHNLLQTVWKTNCWNAMKRSLGKVHILQGTSNTVTSSQRHISFW